MKNKNKKNHKETLNFNVCHELIQVLQRIFLFFCIHETENKNKYPQY